VRSVELRLGEEQALGEVGAANAGAAEVSPVRSAGVRSARLRSAPMRSAPRRLAPVRSARVRRAPMLAKQAATVDAISGGRLILGLGAGWNELEYRAFGFPYDHRVSRFEEAFGPTSTAPITGSRTACSTRDGGAGQPAGRHRAAHRRCSQRADQPGPRIAR
jgi:Luciferase-like monooxygenase